MVEWLGKKVLVNTFFPLKIQIKNKKTFPTQMVGGIANDYNDIIKTLHIMDADELKSNYFFSIRIGFPQKKNIFISAWTELEIPYPSGAFYRFANMGSLGRVAMMTKYLLEILKDLLLSFFSFSKKIYFLNPDTLTWEAVRNQIKQFGFFFLKCSKMFSFLSIEC